MDAPELAAKLEDLYQGSFFTRSGWAVGGPDGFPYLVASRGPVKESEIVDSVSFLELMEQSLQLGAGIVVEPFSEAPDWVFTYGQIWGAAIRGNLGYLVNGDEAPRAEGLDSDVTVLALTDELLPGPIRQALRAALQRAEPNLEFRVACVQFASDAGAWPIFVFGSEGEAASAGGAQVLTTVIDWHLPPFFGLRLIRPEGELWQYAEPL